MNTNALTQHRSIVASALGLLMILAIVLGLRGRRS